MSCGHVYVHVHLGRPLRACRRAKFGFNTTDIVFFAIGAMTVNKGVTSVIRNFVTVYQEYPGGCVLAPRSCVRACGRADV
jgi:hypothetical protein